MCPLPFTRRHRYGDSSGRFRVEVEVPRCEGTSPRRATATSPSCTQASILRLARANTELGFEEDQRTYEIAGEILEAYRVKSINLITNNPRKLDELKKYGINIKSRIPIHIKPNVHNKDYIKIKSEKMNHLP